MDPSWVTCQSHTDPSPGEADESDKAGKSVLFDGSEKIPSLKLTAKAPENGWLEDDCFFLGCFGRFSEAFAVSFRECSQDEICSNLDTNVECLKMRYTRTCQSRMFFG